MKSTTKIIKKPVDAIKELEKISKSFKGVNSVKVGLPRDSNAYPDGTSVIMVGAVHEFGSPSKGIPQRSFLRSSLNENKRKYKKLLAKLTKSVIRGKITMTKALGLLGLQAQTDVRGKIIDIKSPKLKHRKGNPLVDTGHLVESIVFKVGD